MSRSPLLFLLTVVLVASTVSFTAAQTPSGDIPGCATKLAPCFGFLNGNNTPASTCCGPLKETVTNDKKCLCGIYNNPGLIQTFNINVTLALNLISRCHVDSVKDPQNFCKGSALAPSSSPSSSGSTPKPSGGASGASTSSPKNDAAEFTRTHIGLVSILLIVGAHTMFFY